MRKMTKIQRILLGLMILSMMMISIGQAQQRVVRPSMVIDFPDGGPNFRFYNKIDENDTLSRWRYSLVWHNIIEYSDTNQNGIFDNGTDTLVRNISIQNIDFNFAKVGRNLTSPTNEIVTGSQMEFHGNGTIDSTMFFLTITIGWWNGVALHPYGSQFIKVDESQAKYSIEISNWNFKSQNNRLSILASIVTTTNLDSYDVTKYSNGTLSMITKNNPDGKGKRGGIIDNPNMTLIDNNTFKQMNTSISQTKNDIDIQYSFPSFTDSLLYDPTYSAVATVAGTTHNSTTAGVPGFELFSLFMTVVTIKLIKKKKINRNR